MKTPQTNPFPERDFVPHPGLVSEVNIINTPPSWSAPVDYDHKTTFPDCENLQCTIWTYRLTSGRISGNVRVVAGPNLTQNQAVQVILLLYGYPSYIDPTTFCPADSLVPLRLEKDLGTFILKPGDTIIAPFTFTSADVRERWPAYSINRLSNIFFASYVFVGGSYTLYQPTWDRPNDDLNEGAILVKDLLYSLGPTISVNFSFTGVRTPSPWTVDAEIVASSPCPLVNISLSNIYFGFQGYKYKGNTLSNYNHKSPTGLEVDFDGHVQGRVRSSIMSAGPGSQTTFHIDFQPDGAVPGQIRGPTASYPTPYCAIKPKYISFTYTAGDGEHRTMAGQTDAPYLPMGKLPGDQAVALKLYQDDPGCPVTASEACGIDPHVSLSEVCHPTTRAAAFCLSNYQDPDLHSNGFCADAARFTNTLSSVWNVNENFVQDWNDLDKASSLYYFTNRSSGGDTADIVFVATHGCVSDSDADLSVWPKGSAIFTHFDGLRFGDFPGRLSVLTLAACWVLSDNQVATVGGKCDENADAWDNAPNQPPVSYGYMFERWGNVFKGGLRIAVGGAEGETYSDAGLSSTDDNPENYVRYLTDRPIVNAFMDAWQNWDVDQHVGGIASGKSASECVDRLQNMTFASIKNYPRLYDDDVHYLCQEHVFHDGMYPMQLSFPLRSPESTDDSKTIREKPVREASGQIVPVLRLVPVPLEHRVAEQLAKSLFDGHLGADLSIEEPEDKTWDESFDSTSIRFLNRSAFTKSHYLATETNANELATIASTFLTDRLLPDAVFRKLFLSNSEAKFVLTDSYSYLITVFEKADAKRFILYKTFVFTRQYSGLQILGPSHKIAISVTPDKRIIGLEIRLPRFTEAGEWREINPGDIVAQQLLSLTKTTSKEETLKSEIKKVSCGYFDSRDALKRANRASTSNVAIIEPVCIATLTVRDPKNRARLQRFVVPITRQP